MSTGVKTFGFGLRAMKKFPELVPLVGIITGACVMASAFIGYALATKPDVRKSAEKDVAISVSGGGEHGQVVKSRGPAYEDVLPTESRKIINLDRTKYQPNPELQQLRKEIGSYKA